jgi:hypothetical protein
MRGSEFPYGCKQTRETYHVLPVTFNVCPYCKILLIEKCSWAPSATFVNVIDKIRGTIEHGRLSVVNLRDTVTKRDHGNGFMAIALFHASVPDLIVILLIDEIALNDPVHVYSWEARG